MGILCILRKEKKDRLQMYWDPVQLTIYISLSIYSSIGLSIYALTQLLTYACTFQSMFMPTNLIISIINSRASMVTQKV